MLRHYRPHMNQSDCRGVLKERVSGTSHKLLDIINLVSIPHLKYSSHNCKRLNTCGNNLPALSYRLWFLKSRAVSFKRGPPYLLNSQYCSCVAVGGVTQKSTRMSPSCILQQGENDILSVASSPFLRSPPVPHLYMDGVWWGKSSESSHKFHLLQGALFCVFGAN